MIHRFNEPNLFVNHFLTFTNRTAPKEVFILDNFFIFSENEEVTQNIINSYFFNIPELEKVKNLLNQANRGISFRIKEKKKISMIFEEMLNLEGLECYIALLKIFDFLIKVEDFDVLLFLLINKFKK